MGTSVVAKVEAAVSDKQPSRDSAGHANAAIQRKHLAGLRPLTRRGGVGDF